VPIIGTSPESIDIAEDRERFQHLINDLKLKQPPNRTARNEAERPAPGRRESAIRWWCARATCWAAARWNRAPRRKTLSAICAKLLRCRTTRRLLLDRFLNDAIEVDVDALCDGKNVCIGGIMEHIEEAGVHSGDSACSLPPHSLSDELQNELALQTAAMALVSMWSG